MVVHGLGFSLVRTEGKRGWIMRRVVLTRTMDTLVLPTSLRPKRPKRCCEISNENAHGLLPAQNGMGLTGESPTTDYASKDYCYASWKNAKASNSFA